jgi:hypothetical protein
MRSSLACVVALCLGTTTSVVAQNGVPYGPSSVPDAGAPLEPAGPYATNDGAPAYPIPAYAKPQLAWFNAEYVLWWVRDQNAPSLIQVIPDSVANVTPLPAGSVQTLFPAKNQINYSPFNGVRLTAGLWLDSASTFGLDGSAFVLQQNSRAGAIYSIGSPIIAQGYVSANSGVPTSLQLSSPDPVFGYTGGIGVRSTISSIMGFDANFRCNGYAIFADNTDYLFGARYFNFHEQLDIVGQANFKNGLQLVDADHFATNNQFYGAQIGVDSRLCGFRGFSLEGIVKLAIGGVHQTASVSGYNSFTYPNGVVDRQVGGLYAQPSNIGNYSQNKLGVMPEVGLNFSYNLNDNCAIYVGYNLLMLNNVARPGGSIDPNINDANVRFITNPTTGNAPNPVFRFSEESFWVQGITAGFRLQF